ncbi:MAG: hypothetical protein Q7K39_01920 [Candidatus Magasanikbacteria bacterium]|nr:hypothetical protein [Candidatus Magasanikbacteria bacterium]
MDSPASSKVSFLKNLYLYLVSFVALMMMVFSLGDVINIVLRTYVFTLADKNIYGYPEPTCDLAAATGTPRGKEFGGPPCLDKASREKQETENRAGQRQRDLVRDLSMIIVGLPLFGYHWWLVRRKEA